MTARPRPPRPPRRRGIRRHHDRPDAGLDHPASASTWTIIGSPQMSARGFPGRRVEAMRAGMRTIRLCISGSREVGRKTGLIRVAKPRAKRPNQQRGRRRAVPRPRPTKAPAPITWYDKPTGPRSPCSGPSCFAMLLVASGDLVFARNGPAVYQHPAERHRRLGRGPDPPPRQGDAAARPARQGRRQEGRAGFQGLRDLPRFRERGEQDRAAALGRGRPIGSLPGFAYSNSLKKVGGERTYEKLDHWIAEPKGMASATKMAFPGEKNHKRTRTCSPICRRSATTGSEGGFGEVDGRRERRGGAALAPTPRPCIVACKPSRTMTYRQAKICQGLSGSKCMCRCRCAASLQRRFARCASDPGPDKSQHLHDVKLDVHQEVMKARQVVINATVLFADLAPRAVDVRWRDLDLLDAFYDECAEAIWEHDGLLNKTVGDAVMAVVPISRSGATTTQATAASAAAPAATAAGRGGVARQGVAPTRGRSASASESIFWRSSNLESSAERTAI